MNDALEFHLYGLRGDSGNSAYERIGKSHLVPSLDFALLTRFATRKDQPQALKEFREILRGSR